LVKIGGLLWMPSLRKPELSGRFKQQWLIAAATYEGIGFRCAFRILVKQKFKATAITVGL